MKPKTSQNLDTSARIRISVSIILSILGKRVSKSPTESRVEILDDPDLPVRAGGGDPENFGGTLVLVAKAERALLVLLGLGDWCFGFEIGGSLGPGRREDDPPVGHGVLPQFGAPTLRRGHVF